MPYLFFESKGDGCIAGILKVDSDFLDAHAAEVVATADKYGFDVDMQLQPSPGDPIDQLAPDNQTMVGFREYISKLPDPAKDG